MTCIIGLVHDSAVYIGGDSAGVGSYDLTVRADPKVFRNGPYLMGFTSSFRMGQLLQYAELPEVDGSDLHRFMATTFINAVREVLKSGGYAKKENDREEGGTFLVGIRGRLFAVEADYQVAEAVDGYLAVGCGNQVALGALFATTGRPNAEERIDIALHAAERLNAGVRGPFIILTLEPAECEVTA